MLVVLKEYLSDYNAISKKPMQLVLFQFALEHVSRICRVITSPGWLFVLDLDLRNATGVPVVTTFAVMLPKLRQAVLFAKLAKLAKLRGFFEVVASPA